MSVCPFCEIISTPDHGRIVAQNELAFVIRDGFPVTDGHALIIPKRHTGSFFGISAEERSALFTLLDAQKTVLDREFQSDGYNIGINDGAAAGQTVPHLHIHLIPRYAEEGHDKLLEAPV